MTSPQAQQFEYSGVENLEAMKYARRYNQFLVGLVRRHVTGHRLLDFGAGAGTFAHPLREAGHDVTCVEPDPSLCQQLSSAGFNSHITLEDVGNASVDSVYSLNVLEHIEDDRQALTRLREKLTPSGRLVLYVPAFNVLYSAMDARVGHHRRYRRKHLTTMIKQVGFTIDKASYIDSLGFPAALLYRFVGNTDGVISPRSVQIYDRLVFPLSRALDHACAGSVGKNLLVVATRS